MRSPSTSPGCTATCKGWFLPCRRSRSLNCPRRRSRSWQHHSGAVDGTREKRSAKLPATDRPDAAEDDDAFAREMRDVVRLEPDPRGRVRSVAPISPPRHSPQRTEHADVSDHDFVAHGVDRREIRKLKKGEYIVRDRRDLHGMTGAEAVASVGRFIENSRHRGHRCVCIIHGRGLHSKGNPPILKTRVRDTSGRTGRSSRTRTRRCQTAVRAPFTCCCGSRRISSSCPRRQDGRSRPASRRRPTYRWRSA